MNGRNVASAVLAATILVALIPAFVTSMGATEFVEQPQAGTTYGLSLTDDSPSVKATTGDGVALDGSQNVTVPTGNITTGSWTLCAAGSLGDSANRDATYTLAAADDGSAMLLYSNGSWVAWMQNESGATARAAVPAPSPGNGFLDAKYTPVCGRYTESNTTLRIRAAGEEDTDQLDATADPRNVSQDWIGAVDELRSFNNSVSNATLTAYTSEPARPFPSENRTVRVMFDRVSGGSTRVYWASTSSVSLNGASITSGVSDFGPDAGSDYTLAEDPLTITILAGGDLEGAPFVVVSGDLVPLGLEAPLAILFVLVAGLPIIAKLANANL